MGNVIIGGGGTDTLVGGKRTVAGTAAQRGLGKVDPRLVAIIDAAAARSPYDVQIFSGKRFGSQGGSRHNSGNALDIALIDPTTGQVVPNYKSSTGFPIYAEFAKIAREEQMRLAPDMADQFRWGGGFSDKSFDLMHFDFKPGGAMAYWTWEDGGKLTPAGARDVPKFGPGYVYANGERYKAPPGQYASLWGREPLQSQPQDAQSAIANLLDPGGGTQVPEPPTAAMGFAPTIPAGGFNAAPPAPTQVASAPPMPQPPPQWAQAGGFPMDEALTGQSAQDVLMGGPRMDPRRVPPGTGPMPPDMGAMRSPADVLNAGPSLRPGGAPDASMVPTPGISPMRPAVGGPNDRRPQPPNPPPRAQGIPDPRIRPDPASLPQRGFPTVFGEQPGPPAPLTDADRQRILADLADFRQRDQQTTVAGMPDIPRPAFQSRIAGRPEFPGAIQPSRNDIPELPPPSEPRVPASTALTPALMDRLRQAQGIGPFSSRPEFPGALPAAPNPYDDPSRQFDIPDPFTLMADSQPPPAPTPPQEARTKDDAYTRGRDFSIAAPAPLITQNIPPSPFGPTGNVVGPQDDAGSGRQAFIDANRAPTPIDSTTGTWSDLPDPTPPGLPSPPIANWRDQFNISFSPGGPGMIADLTPPTPQPPTAPPGNPFDALMGPGAAMGAMPFNDTAQGIGAPDFSITAPPSPFDSAPTSDLGIGQPQQNIMRPPAPQKPALMSGATAFYRPDAPDPTFAGGSVVSPNSPNAIGATDTQAMPGRTFVDPAKYGQPPVPPPSPVAQSATMGLPKPGTPPRQTNVGANRRGAGVLGRLLGGVLGGPIGALAGGLLGGGGNGILGGNGFGFGGQPSFAWSGGGNAPYGNNGGTTTYQKGTSNALGGSNALSWKGSNGQTVTVVQDPWGGGYYGPTYS